MTKPQEAPGKVKRGCWVYTQFYCRVLGRPCPPRPSLPVGNTEQQQLSRSMMYVSYAKFKWHHHISLIRYFPHFHVSEVGRCLITDVIRQIDDKVERRPLSLSLHR